MFISMYSATVGNQTFRDNHGPRLLETLKRFSYEVPITSQVMDTSEFPKELQHRIETEFLYAEFVEENEQEQEDAN